MTSSSDALIIRQVAGSNARGVGERIGGAIIWRSLLCNAAFEKDLADAGHFAAMERDRREVAAGHDGGDA